MNSGSKKGLIAAAVIFSLMLAVVCGIYIFRKAMNTPQLPVLGQVKPFRLIDSEQKEFDSQILYRNVWIASLFSTPCQEGCADMMKNMASLSRTFELIPALKLISVSINPQQDTPNVLDDYRNTFNKGKGNWYFLTGEMDTIKDLQVHQLKAEVPSNQGGFSLTLSLMDRSGYIRGYYDGTQTEEINQLFVDASLLLKERF